jgi:hypothetical protein
MRKNKMRDNRLPARSKHRAIEITLDAEGLETLERSMARFIGRDDAQAFVGLVKDGIQKIDKKYQESST